MEGILTDFGDRTLDYHELMNKKVAVISLVISKNVICSNPDIETFKSIGLNVAKDKKRDNEKLKNFLIEKIISLEKLEVRFLVENIKLEDSKNEKIGKWRLRLDPDLPYCDRFVFNGHTIILECIRKQKRLSVWKISLQKVSRRPSPSEGLFLGPVLILRDETKELPDETYMRDADFQWLQALPRRRIDLEERLNEWNEYLSAHLTSIKNKQAWIGYRNLERINPTRAKIQISTHNYSKNAYKSFYPSEVVSIINERIPDDKDWKPNEDTRDPEQIGTIAENADIKKYIISANSYKIEEEFDSEKIGSNNGEDEWVDLEIELEDRYIYDIEEFSGSYDEAKISKDPLNSFPRSGLLVNSVFADEFPLYMQEKAIERLIEGNSVNPRLEDFLFDITAAKEPSRKEVISKNTLVQKDLNEKQLEALEKSLNAPDISLIQGPPGTGKTTVIAELCHQTILRDGKVLIASQSNLAVDNALSRLANKSEIMPIRIGKYTTEEGSDFVEENVVQRWFTSVKENIDKFIENQDLLIEDLESYEHSLKEIKEFNNHKEILNKEIEIECRKLEFFVSEICSKETENSDYDEKINSLSSILSILSSIQSSQRYPEKENFQKLAEVYPPIVELLNKKLELIYTSSNLEFIHNYNQLALGEVLSYFYDIIKNLPEMEQQFRSLQELIVQLNRLPNDEIQKLKETRDGFKLQMDEVTDTSQMEFLSNKVIEINVEIKKLQNQNNKEKLSENWKKTISSLNMKLSSLSSLFELTSSKDTKMLVDELKSSLSPDNVFESIMRKLSYLFGSLDEKTFRLPTSLLDDVNKLEQCHKQKKEEIEETVNNLEADLSSLKTKQEDLDKIIEYKKEEITTLDKSITFSLKTILRIGFSRNLGHKLEYRDIEPSILNSDILKHLESDFLTLKKDSKLQLNKSNKWLMLQKEWSDRIKKSTTEDYSDLVDVYIDSANVVGATCTETGKHRFWGKEGREFDLVIIDEVSKATFPELLMPMLLGNQIVLVGDHQQLPPTFRLGEGELTLQEIDDEESIKQRLKKFETLVTTSYFREMFEKANPSLKSRLLKQYRMHPTIMNAINQFYPSEYKLECGINNPDESRENKYVIEGEAGALSPKNSHLIWVDTSEKLVNREKYRNFEKRESGKYTSRYNEFEVQIIERILISLNKQFESINKKNAPAQDIAIISFYAGQVRKLRTMADKLKMLGHLSNIKYRIGTVDRFQGMERSIVIVSLVSSPPKNGPTSFVKEFRRINVAFSRAQSLLIIVGSKRTFEDVEIEIHYDNGEVFRRQSYNEIIKASETGINGNCYLKGYDVV